MLSGTDYSTTAIESGLHLSRCLFYIDMNIVCAGVVDHPRDLKQSGYHELAGQRKRYLVINKNRLMSCLLMDGDIEGFTDWYNRSLEESLERAYHTRAACWTDAHAVGNEPWLKEYLQEARVQEQENSTCRRDDEFRYL